MSSQLQHFCQDAIVVRCFACFKLSNGFAELWQGEEWDAVAVVVGVVIGGVVLARIFVGSYS